MTRELTPTDPLAIALVQQNRARGAALASIVLDGLEGMIENARVGDLGSRAVLRRFAEAFDAARAIAAVRLPDEAES